MTKSKFKSTLAALGVGLAFASAPAAAAITFFSPITTFEDDNLDFIVDTDGSGTVTVGDRLVAVLKFNQTTGILGGQGPAPIAPTELTAVSDITAIGVTLDGRLIFGPSGATGVLAAFGPTTTAVLFHDTSPDTNVINSACGTRLACLASAGLAGDPGSSVYASIGFTGDPDEIWISGAGAVGQSIATIQTGPASASFQTFSYSQGMIINNTGMGFQDQPCAPFCSGLGDGFADVIGSGSILGGKGLIASEWTGRTDNDTQVMLPEPGTLALLAMGLLGFGFGFRKRNS